MSAAVLQERLVYADSFNDLSHSDLSAFSAQLDMHADTLFADLGNDLNLIANEDFVINELIV
ncbi:MAG: hypothetical protein RL208_461 [Pseudomonadota bacterium]|jgi:hypothetical protein